MYKTIDQNDLKAFREMLGFENVLEKVPEAYNRDEMPIYGDGNGEVVLVVKNTQEISSILVYANEHRIPVTTRGSGTGLVGACVPLKGGIILSTVKMNKIIKIEPETMTCVVEPGVLLMKLNAELEKYNCFYAPDPGEKSATLGGNASTNAGGMRAIKYGVTREYIKALEVVLADGSIQRFGKGVNKNSSGYALKDLIIGAEGTLGVISQLTIKLLPKPMKFTSLLIPFDTIHTALEVVPFIVQLSDVCTTLEFMEKEVLDDAKEYLGKDFPDRNYPAYLIVSYSANSHDQMKIMLQACADTVMSHGARNVFISDTTDRQENLWNTRGAFLEAIKNSTSLMDECDVVVPIVNIAYYLDFVRSLSEEYGIRIRTFGHAGDGNLHVYLCKDAIEDERWMSIVEEIMDKLYRKAEEFDGAVSGEHGIGHAKKVYLRNSVGDEQIRLMSQIKQIFDPNHILNPGKIFD